MQELKGRTLAFIAEKFSEVAALSQDLVGLADTLLSGLAKVHSNTAAQLYLKGHRLVTNTHC